MTTYRLAIADQMYVDIAMREGVCLMNGGREAALDGLSLGDRVVFYAPSDKPNGTSVNAYVAIATITGQRLRKTDWDGVNGFKAWVMPCTYADATPLHEPLDYDAPVMDIEAGEFDRIAKAMKVT
ncbi:hypothetical protein [Nereida sp. MMG025]|uniref:hypothetical protein n=1 Tax=Nereida sp. MMG025 TaxID=2909981 RepID=UPI001F1D55C8|nr:hypothetical protein [Nereida sp. MMG025]MCF6444205.1 hypothetical protein [Nereida sp. MMG025]